MRTKENLKIAFSVEFPNANIVGMLNDDTFFSGIIDAKDTREFAVGMYRSYMRKISFVYDIEEQKYFFTEFTK